MCPPARARSDALARVRRGGSGEGGVGELLRERQPDPLRCSDSFWPAHLCLAEYPTPQAGKPCSQRPQIFRAPGSMCKFWIEGCAETLLPGQDVLFRGSWQRGSKIERCLGVAAGASTGENGFE